MRIPTILAQLVLTEDGEVLIDGKPQGYITQWAADALNPPPIKYYYGLKGLDDRDSYACVSGRSQLKVTMEMVLSVPVLGNSNTPIIENRGQEEETFLNINV